MRWFWKRHRPESAARAALRCAENSNAQADRDLKRAVRNLHESKEITSRLREHNAANHYDDWLCEQFLRYYATPSSGEKS
jgi:hypothetical protein